MKLTFLLCKVFFPVFESLEAKVLTFHFFMTMIDIPAWLRSLRLHKYTPIFEKMSYKDMIKLSDEDLEKLGVAALGARRKMLKVFTMVLEHLEAVETKGS